MVRICGSRCYGEVPLHLARVDFSAKRLVLVFTGVYLKKIMMHEACLATIVTPVKIKGKLNIF